MKYLSVCSGIEAATVAWHDLGWSPVAFSEIEAFPSAVLGTHYPDVPNWGDMTKFQEWPYAAVDVLVGGTPCQSFSVAGLRKGLADPRGNLALTYLAIAHKYRPRWVVWENVPGVLSSAGGRDFGAFLGGLGELGYGWAYRVLDAQYFGVPQRRRRVFVVGCLGGWQRAAAVLFERHSLSGHPAPRREAGESIARGIGGGPEGGRVAGAVKSKWAKGSGVPAGDECYNMVAHILRAQHGSEDGTGRGVPIVPMAIQGNLIGRTEGGPCGVGVSGDGVMFTLTKQDVHGVALLGGIDYQHNGHTAEEPTGPLLKGSPTGGGAPLPAVAFTQNTRDEARYIDGDGQPAGALAAESGMRQTNYVAYALNSHAGAADGDQTNRSHAGGGPVGLGVSEELAYSLRGGRTQSVGSSMAVRRLTPRECERLQGFPDDYTAIPYRGKPAADGPRYKALGNSMAVPVMRWIGQRLQSVHEIPTAPKREHDAR